MSNRSQRGLSSNQEQDARLLIRDVRPMTQRISDFYAQPENVGYFLAFIGAATFIFPVIINLAIVFIIISFIIAANQKLRLPFRLPQRSKEKDYGDLGPTGKPKEGRGIYYFGNEREKKTELWFANEDMRTHVLIFGSTGSGKTETLVSIAYNALVQASGFIYVDGKGDNSLFAKIFSMMKQMGREDDLLLINFMTGARDIIGAQEKRTSNTMNPFSQGSSGMLSNLVSSMMDSGGSGGDGDMWKGRAIAFVEAIMKILVYQRDAGNILLDPDSIRNYFSLDRLEAISADKVFIRDGQFDISLEDVPEVVLKPIDNYLKTLPGYVPERKGKQVSQVFEQHGFITMQLTRTFSTFADTYGHIMKTKLAEVDLKDVVLNRRVLNVLLPALEKSPDELSNLGKIVIASLKTMMASGLGDSVEGTFQDVITRKPTNANTPFLCILDEYGYYAVKGFAVVPAQARSLGFSVVFAGQDLPAFQKASKEEAASIGANTNIKICMKLEDPTDTWEFFLKGAGESYVTAVESFSAQGPTMTGAYSDTKGAKAEKRARIDLLDLKDQTEGEFHIFFKSNIVRGSSFYVNPQPVKSMRLNQFLKVDIPKDEILYTLVKSIEDLEVLLSNGPIKLNTDEDEELNQVIAISENQSKVKLPIEKGIGVLFEYHKQEISKNDQDKIKEPMEILESPSEDTIDTSTSSNDYSVPDLNSNNSIYIDIFIPLLNKSKEEKSILDKQNVKKKAVYISKLLGRNSSQANKDVDNTLSIIEKTTRYENKKILNIIDKNEVCTNIDSLVLLLNGDLEKGRG